MALSEDARKELREAINIVREDKFETYARDVLLKHTKKEEPVKDPGKDPNGPPPKPEDEKTDPPKARKGGYWGELLSDDE